MRLCSSFQRLVAGFVMFIFFLFSTIVAPAQAAMIGTAELLCTQKDDFARQKVYRFLEREDVANHLKAWGVGADEARLRVDAMTDEEIHLLAAKIDQMPAGGDAVGVILLVSIVAFMTLVITDILGVTDVFTFIKKR